MGFNAVFSSLKEVFPQVDFRVLKAVAIEHSNDLDAAVEDVLNEVIPFLKKRPDSPAKVQSPRDQPTPVEPEELIHQEVDKEAGVGALPEAGAAAGEDADISDHTRLASSSFREVTILGNDTNSMQNVLASSDVYQPTAHLEVESLNTRIIELKESYLEAELEHSPFGHLEVESASTRKMEMQNSYPEAELTTSLILEKDAFHDSLEYVPHELDDSNFQATGDLTDSRLEGESSMVEVDPPFLEHAPDTVASNQDGFPEHAPGAVASKKDGFLTDMGDVEESATNSICNIDALEEIMEDATNNKKTLFSAMDSVITMMREVELEERAVDLVREEAARGGQDIMVKVEELKQMLAHAKDANDMHAGEVYGEKAILSTEVRELQSRLLLLSEERNKSLAVLEEMRETLEARLAAVSELRKMAEEEKLEKEETARKALAEQESIMEKVVQESKKLQQAAEENSKLREFLMDRGHIVDVLQGEISVICQDVRLLKEKFDERVPLSQSVSSSQTTCILASSGSSVKSIASDLLQRFETVESPKSSSSSVKSMASDFLLEQVESPKTLEKPSPADSGKKSDERSRLDKQALMEDGWDVFDEDLLQF